jgi:hypothetical protein
MQEWSRIQSSDLGSVNQIVATTLDLIQDAEDNILIEEILARQSSLAPEAILRLANATS